MRKIIFYVALMLIGREAFCQEIKFACYYGEKSTPDLACMRARQNSFAPNTDASEAIRIILKPLGLAPNFVTVACEQISNCAAMTLNDGFRYIVYDKKFMDVIAKEAKTNWAYTSILAHEIGHHLQGHLTATTYEQSQKQELEADKFSGFVMARLGATLSEAQAAMRALKDPPDENFSTHPLRWRRLKAIKEGFDDANESRTVEPVDPSISKTGNTEMHMHDIIKSEGFPDVKKSWDNGFNINQAIYAQNYWYVFMTKDASLKGSQSYRIRSSFPSDEIKDLWDKHKRITSLNYYNYSWVLVMTESKNDPPQFWSKGPYFPEVAIDSGWNAGYYITDIGFGNNEWVVVMNDKKNIDYESQHYNASTTFPNGDIRSYWDKGYIISVLKYINNEWVLVMTKYKGSSGQAQRWNTADHFPMDVLLKNESEGFLLKCAAFDGSTWAIVTNK